MKALYYGAVIGLLLFEIANVYFIMPMPGSQEMNSIGIAYFLYSGRWWMRGALGLLALFSFNSAYRASKWATLLGLACLAGGAYATNFVMAADSMFLQPTRVIMKPMAENKIDSSRLVIGIALDSEARAYPVQFLGYHHQVRDSIGGRPVMVTYCTVCRTGRVFEPVIFGKTENFRLVGMDHFNAMLEDQTTKSWWRQATGEAVAGPLTGHVLPELSSNQMSLREWCALYPHTLVMQPDAVFQVEYDSLANYESGRRTGKLTRRDTASWQEKSWVVGVVVKNGAKAYDWNVLQNQHIINDVANGVPVVVVLAPDGLGFVAFQRDNADQVFGLQGDTLIAGEKRYNFTGNSITPDQPGLKKLKAYQEYWHSWRTFHPDTEH